MTVRMSGRVCDSALALISGSIAAAGNGCAPSLAPSPEERKLCVIEDAELIKQLKAKHLALQPGQTQLQLTPAAHPAHPAPTTSTAAVPTATVAAGTVASIPVASEDDPDHEASGQNVPRTRPRTG